MQNGTTPPRIVRFSLDLRTQEILEANTPWLGEPTHGTIAGGEFYFLANTGWGSYDEKAGRSPERRRSSPPSANSNCSGKQPLSS